MELSIHTRMLRIPLYIWNHPQPLSHMVQHAADRFAPFPPKSSFSSSFPQILPYSPLHHILFFRKKGQRFMYICKPLLPTPEPPLPTPEPFPCPRYS